MNQDIKEALRNASLKQWQLAKQLGISEFTLVRWLRDELSAERKTAIYSAIETLKAEGAAV